ncbi:MAG: DUF4340 domain-containing protein [Kiritimatiellae bacterium]|nr:DUF4340 domain-containing protein [Kiritimatiellia bacterium]
MTNKNLVILAAAAAVLGGAAYYCNSGRKIKSSNLNGKPVLAAFDVSEVAKVEVGGSKKLTLAATDGGWVVDSLYGYPADVTKIRENLLKLKDLTVGQTARGRKIENGTLVELKDAKGKVLASATLGEQHMSKPRGQAAQFGGGGYPDGRYMKFGDGVVLVKDALEAFDGDPKKWCEGRICSVPSADVKAVSYTKDGKTVNLTRKDSTWSLEGLGEKEELDTSKTYSLDSALSYLDFNNVADPKKPETEFGFATGCVYKVSLKNGQSYTAKIGAASGADRYFKVSAAFAPVGTNATENATLEKAVKDFNANAGKWTYLISSYSADSMSKSRKDLVKAKEEPKKDEKKDGDKSKK